MNKNSHMFFQNLDIPEIQQKIKKFCQGKSGVYKISNLSSQKNYIGSAITKKSTGNRLYIRFRNHFFNHHKEFPLKQAIKKYGVSNFSWEILEFTEISNTRTKETWYIQNLLPEYNILKSGGSSLGYSHTTESKKKMKKLYSNPRRQAKGSVNKGKTFSVEFRKKLSEAALNRTIEQKQRHKQICTKWNKKMFSKPTQILHGNTLQVLGNYSSLREACRAWNGDYRTFKRAVKSKKKIYKLNIYVKYYS